MNARAYLSRFNFTGADQEKKIAVLAYAPWDGPPEDRVVVATIVEAANIWESWSNYATNIIMQGIFANQTYEEAVAALGWQYLINNHRTSGARIE